MKILSIILIILLLAVGGVSGYFIRDLNEQIDELETTLSDTVEQMSLEINGEINSKYATIEDELDYTREYADNLSSLTDEKLNDLNNELFQTSRDITTLDARSSALEEFFESTTIDSVHLYEQVNRAVVRITDGETLSGSGFIMNGSLDGTTSLKPIITAYHVVEDLTDIYISLYDGRTWKAFIRIFSIEADVAILELLSPPDMSSFVSLELADSASIHVGDPVLVIGSPIDEELTLGLKESATSGIVSQINRSITIDETRISGLIQYDAASNFGNSGGPLIDNNGKVIGIIIAAINPLIGDGINYAGSSNIINKLVSADISGQVTPVEYGYPWIGITAEDMTPTDVLARGESIYSGAKITEVTGPASEAGLESGDIITSFNGIPVTCSDEYYSYLALFGVPGETITLGKAFGDDTVTFTVTVSEKPQE